MNCMSFSEAYNMKTSVSLFFLLFDLCTHQIHLSTFYDLIKHIKSDIATFSVAIVEKYTSIGSLRPIYTVIYISVLPH